MRLLPILLLLLCLSGCATRRLPPYEKPLKRARYQTVRTTAYTHTEKDHRRHQNRNALGTPLRHDGVVNSAATDWARWPAGTRFRIVGMEGPVWEVDDYGWALAGTNTIDLYFPNARSMRGWGVRRVKIEILYWGDPKRSERILKPRRKHKHVRRMLKEIRKFY